MPINTSDLSVPFGTSNMFLPGQIIQPQLTIPVRNSGVILPGGRAVVLNGTGMSENLLRVQLPVDGSSVFFAISCDPKGIEKRDGYSIDSNGNFGWPANSVATVMLVGIIAVPLVEAIVATDSAFWIHTPGSGEEKGEWRNDANTATAVQLSRARWLSSGANNDVIPLQFSNV